MQHAQRTPEERAARQTEMMTRKLSLTEEQNKKVYEINLKSAQQMQTSFQAKDPKSMRAAREEKDAALLQVLTPEQGKRYEEMKKERQEHRREMMQEQNNLQQSEN